MRANDSHQTTIEEFEHITPEEGFTYELLDGLILMTPRPNEAHQSILFNLSGEIHQCLKTHQTYRGYSEFEMQVDDTILVPDLMIICNKDNLTSQRYLGAPLIAVEILSPSTMRRDLIYKLNKYEQIGVAEYWIIDPKGKTITVHDFLHESSATYTANERIQSTVLDVLAIQLNDIFA